MTKRWSVNPWGAARPRSAASVMLAISSSAGCTPARPASPAALPAYAISGNEATRGIYVDPPGLGFDHALQLHQLGTSATHELHDGGEVMTGDRLRATIQTSEDAHLYLAFCAHHQLAVYPSQRGIQTRAGQLMTVPPAGGDLVFDGEPGKEVLYVILSRTELSLADPRLAQALAATRPGNTPTDCAANLDAKFATLPPSVGPASAKPPGSPNVLRGKAVRKMPLPPRTTGSNHIARPTHAPPRPPAGAPPDPDFERSLDFEQNPGALVWYQADGATGPVDVVAADDDGIAVVRHAFKHVAQTSPP